MAGTLFLLAITGSMGCGKSVVSRKLTEWGGHLLDADQEARAVLTPGSVGWQAVVERFGTAIMVQPDDSPQRHLTTGWPLSEIDRRTLGQKIFHDPAARATLEAILHPLIYRRQALALAQWQKETPSGAVTVVVAEIPLLFETASEQRFDLTVAVVCGEQQWQRLQERTTMSNDTKRAIMAQQLPENEKKRRANRTIDNSGGWRETEQQLGVLWSEVGALVRQGVHRAWPRAWPEAPKDESLGLSVVET